MSKTNISFKRIQQLAIPAIISGIAEPVLSSTDAAMVGNIEAFVTESLAAVGIVGSFLSMLILILGIDLPKHFNYQATEKMLL